MDGMNAGEKRGEDGTREEIGASAVKSIESV